MTQVTTCVPPTVVRAAPTTFASSTQRRLPPADWDELNMQLLSVCQLPPVRSGRDQEGSWGDQRQGPVPVSDDRMSMEWRDHSSVSERELPPTRSVSVRCGPPTDDEPPSATIMVPSVF